MGMLPRTPISSSLPLCSRCHFDTVQHEGEICQSCNRTDDMRRPSIGCIECGDATLAPGRLYCKICVNHFFPPAPAVKDTNPKDAIGDTKVPLWLLSPIAKVKWAMAQFAGQIKYGSWNWRAAGVRTSVYLSAMERHMEAFKSGEDLDPVDGTHHLGNVMACCAILLDAAAAHKLTDDRPPRVDHRPTIAEAEALMAKLKVQYADRNPRHYTIADSVAPATLNLSTTEGENHVVAAKPVPTNGHPDATRREGRAPGTEEA